jgi:hypothetical protein
VLVYWSIFLILAIGALLNREESTPRVRLMFAMLVSVPTALMIGLRWEIGPDWAGYFEIFSYTKFYSLGQSVSHADPGFFALSWLLHQVDAPFWVLNFVCGLVFVVGLTAFCRQQPNPWLAYLVAFPYLVIVVAMSGDRQSVALGLLFLALNSFEGGRLVRFAFLILIAALFHGSVLLILPFCLLSYTQNGFQRALLLIAAAALGYYFLKGAFNIYAYRYSSDRIQSTGVAYRLAMNAMSAIIFLVFERRFALDAHQARLWRNISWCTLGLALLLIVFPSSTAIDRFLLYLFPLQFVVLSRVPKILTADRHAAGQFTLLVIAYAALVQVTFLGFGKYASYYIPYRSIFQK